MSCRRFLIHLGEKMPYNFYDNKYCVVSAGASQFVISFRCVRWITRYRQEYQYSSSYRVIATTKRAHGINEITPMYVDTANVGVCLNLFRLEPWLRQNNYCPWPADYTIYRPLHWPHRQMKREQWSASWSNTKYASPPSSMIISSSSREHMYLNTISSRLPPIFADIINKAKRSHEMMTLVYYREYELA